MTTLSSLGPTPPRSGSDSPGSASPKTADRWTLSRAGIINVYQYGDETLHFGGGRLLLRGVNGSGKSTAMNMLLPFLLDGDTRRIDAAGEQSGVLRSWMLSGRDEPQPQGYLWLELARGDAYTSFGCGIRANRSTDRVTTWWFITSRRPGIDLHLVEGRVPLAADKLRALIEPGSVYTQDQRANYRAELQARLFGGSDLEQYLHLLRIVRNPRVGDRLDTDLPQYLEDALPQLSDTALDDAAQPLEDLEEHRRNVAELGRTAEALIAIQEVYCNYARSELHRISNHTLASVDHHDQLQREEQRAHEAQQRAEQRLALAAETKTQRDREVVRFDEEVRALETSEAYQSGAQLNDLRSHVRSLDKSATNARDDVQRRHTATQRAVTAVDTARRETEQERKRLSERLTTLAAQASHCGLVARPPAAPTYSISTPTPDRPEMPTQSLDVAAPKRELDALRAAALHRRGDVDEVEAAIRAGDRAEQALRAAERAAQEAESAHAAARSERDEARMAFQTRIGEWQQAASEWLDELDRHCDAYGLDAPVRPAELDDPAHRVALGELLSTPLLQRIHHASQRHEQRRADLEATLARHDETVAELETKVSELAAQQLPDPPVQPWQRRAGCTCLAEWIDFEETLDAAARAGLEAALEASGLLAAEVQTNGALRLTDGQLLAVAGAGDSVASPLSRLLRVTPPANVWDPETSDTVSQILHGISTVTESGDSSTVAATVMAPTGEFRIGTLHGRHAKAQAEHIGVSARRAALERQRAEAAAALARARAERDQIAERVAHAKAALESAFRLRTAIPPERDVLTSFGRRDQAERGFERAGRKLEERRGEVAVAEQRHAEALEVLHRTASRFSLPRALEELRDIRGQLEALIAGCKEAQSELVRVSNALERWRACGTVWEAARADEQSTEARLVEAMSELHVAQTRLATLEESVGAEYARVVSAIESGRKNLETAQRQREEAEQIQLDAKDEVAATRERYQAAQQGRKRAYDACLSELPVLRRTLTVRGLVEAAVRTPRSEVREAPESETPEPASERISFPSIDEHPDGARKLCEAVRAVVPLPAEPLTAADGVRQSLRRRRDTLGAGWDAEDHQPDPSLPLRIDVTGPLAPQIPLAEATAIVQQQLGSMTSLLSAKQDQALRNLLQGLIAREVADKLHAARELIDGMNHRLSAIKTSHGIGVSLRWRQREDLDAELSETVALLAKPPDLRTGDEDALLSRSLGRRIDDARRDDPEVPYRELIARVLDYRSWHRMQLMLHRPGRSDERLSRRTALSEGEKKIVSYLPLFAAVAASCDALAAQAPACPRFVLLDDAFAKVSEDNHPKLFGLLVELDLDFIATSERLWGTHETVPELAITEVIRDADLGTIVLEHSRWKARGAELA